MRDILRVGAASSVVSLSTNIVIATATGLAGLVGPAVVAGYGTGVRLEYLLVPLVFGLGTPVAAMVGTCIGAGRRDRALRVAWTGAAIAGGVTEAIGLAAAFFPSAWLSLFGSDPNMIAVGANYLQIVGPFYGFFGGGLALYFASQGAGRVGWAMMVAVLRVVIAAGGGWFAVIALGNSNGLFVALAAALVVYGLANAAAVAGGAWFKPSAGASVSCRATWVMTAYRSRRMLTRSSFRLVAGDNGNSPTHVGFAAIIVLYLTSVDTIRLHRCICTRGIASGSPRLSNRALPGNNMSNMPAKELIDATIEEHGHGG